MCGISGFLESPGRRRQQEYGHIAGRMADALTHRGPDDRGVWADPDAGIAFGHRRLAILDLSSAGRQPMRSACGRYVIVFNGEIYNLQALRAELERKGHRFAGNSDTEVILAACSEWGVPAALQRLNGMFAFAVWDRKERALELARDRLGQKPLYYGWVNGALLFASELKAFRQFPGFTPNINRDALTLLFRRGCIAAPHSIFHGVYKLQPGHRIRFRGRDLAEGNRDTAQEPYWSALAAMEGGGENPFQGSEDEAADALEQLLRDAVQICMVADVPLGAFLSGGIDSSVIAALMQAESRSPVRTFSIGFWEERYNEAPHAAKVAAHLGTDHTELYVSEQDALGVIPRLPEIYDEPFADSSQIPAYLVSSLARQRVAVALSGDGGDELFGGYAKYRYFDRLRRLALLPEPALLAFFEVACRLPFPDAKRWRAWRIGRVGNWFADRALKEKAVRLGSFLEAAHTPEEMYIQLASIWKKPAELVVGAVEPPTILTAAGRWPRLQPLRQAMAVDMVTYLPDDILVKVDRAAMAVSLETRIPLLDHRVVEFAARLPLRMNYRNGRAKLLLRKVLYRYVPQHLVERPKMGFRVPLEKWLRGELRAWAEELLAPARLRREGVLATDPIRQKWQEHLTGDRDWSGYLWPALMFQAWQERWQAQASM